MELINLEPFDKGYDLESLLVTSGNGNRLPKQRRCDSVGRLWLGSVDRGMINESVNAFWPSSDAYGTGGQEA